MTKAHHITIRTCKITIKAHDRHVMIYKFTQQIHFRQLNRSNIYTVIKKESVAQQ